MSRPGRHRPDAVPDDRVGHVDARPAAEPRAPAQVEVLEVHEHRLVEAAEFEQLARRTSIAPPFALTVGMSCRRDPSGRGGTREAAGAATARGEASRGRGRAALPTSRAAGDRRRTGTGRRRARLRAIRGTAARARRRCWRRGRSRRRLLARLRCRGNRDHGSRAAARVRRAPRERRRCRPPSDASTTIDLGRGQRLRRRGWRGSLRARARPASCRSRPRRTRAQPFVSRSRMHRRAPFQPLRRVLALDVLAPAAAQLEQLLRVARASRGRPMTSSSGRIRPARGRRPSGRASPRAHRSGWRRQARRMPCLGSDDTETLLERGQHQDGGVADVLGHVADDSRPSRLRPERDVGGLPDEAKARLGHSTPQRRERLDQHAGVLARIVCAADEHERRARERRLHTSSSIGLNRSRSTAIGSSSTAAGSSPAASATVARV